MTEELFRSDAYLRECAAVVIAVNENRIQLDKTVFYPEGGGQPGDTGWMILATRSEVPIVDTQYHLSEGLITLSENQTRGLPSGRRSNFALIGRGVIV